jgi:hypothetical protein
MEKLCAKNFYCIFILFTLLAVIISTATAITTDHGIDNLYFITKFNSKITLSPETSCKSLVLFEFMNSLAILTITSNSSKLLTFIELKQVFIKMSFMLKSQIMKLMLFIEGIKVIIHTLKVIFYHKNAYNLIIYIHVLNGILL